MKKLIAMLMLLALVITTCACSGDGAAASDLTAAKDYLFAMYKGAAEATPADYKVVDTLAVGDGTYTVEWTVNVTAGDPADVKVVPGDNHMATVDVNEKAAAEVVYTLVATIKDASGKTETVSFNHRIPAYKEFGFADYVAAEDGDPVVVKGVVTGIIAKSKGNSNNCLYLQGDEGGYYVYGMATDPVADDKIEIGMTVTATGVRTTYSGTLEIEDATVEIVDANKVAVTPVDMTEIFKNAKTLKDEALAGPQAQLVTVKGVEVTGQDAGSGYYKFKLGELETYVRISSSVCPLTADEQAAFKTGHTEHFGWIADVTGVICVYDGAFYLTPVTADAFNYISLPEKSDAEKVAFEKDNLKMPSTISAAGEIDLAAKGSSYDNVAITWASNSDLAVVKGGKLAVTLPSANAEIKLTATLKCGSVTETAEYKITLLAGSLSYAQIVDAAYGLKDGESLDGTYRLFGTIKSIDTAWSDQYKNITVTIEVDGKADKPMMCYRLKGDGAEKLAVGDKITVEGKLKNYKGTIEYDAGCVLVGMGEIADQKKIVENAYALGDGESLSAPSTLTGTISKIDTAYSDQYKNITVTIIVEDLEAKPIMCYRLKGDGADKLAVGNIITVTGTIKNYKGTIEFDAGCTLDKVEVNTAVPLPETTKAPEAVKVPSDPKAIVDAAYTLADGAKMEGTATLTGKVKSIDTAYSAQYGNITVTIEIDGKADKPIQCYRLKGDGADKLAVGDTITVTGELTNYKGKIQFNAGATFTK